MDWGVFLACVGHWILFSEYFVWHKRLESVADLRGSSFIFNTRVLRVIAGCIFWNLMIFLVVYSFFVSFGMALVYAVGGYALVILYSFMTRGVVSAFMIKAGIVFAPILMVFIWFVAFGREAVSGLLL